jgi:hypothetical protein
MQDEFLRTSYLVLRTLNGMQDEFLRTSYLVPRTSYLVLCSYAVAALVAPAFCITQPVTAPAIPDITPKAIVSTRM